MEPEREGPDLYTILQLQRGASDVDIKRAYRNLAQTVHPDKHTDPELHATAERNFNRIHEAYEILSDPQKRSVYDSFGFQGLLSGLEIGSKYQSPEEFRKQFEKLLQREADRKLQARVNHEGVYNFSMSAVDALNNPFNRDKAIPRIHSISMNNSLIAPLSSKDTATMGGSLATQRGMGMGHFLLGMRRQCSENSALECSAVIGPNPSLSLHAWRQLSAHATGAVQSTIHGDGVSLDLIVTRQLAQHWNGRINYSCGSQGGVSVSARRDGERTNTNLEFKVGIVTGVKADMSSKISSKSVLRVAARCDTGGVNVELGAARKLSKHSSAGFSVIVGLQGVIWKVRFTRAGQKFVFPILLYPTLDRKVLLFSLVVPPLTFSLLKHYWLKPAALARRRRIQLERRTRYAVEVAEATEHALADQRLMEAAVTKKRAKEEASAGLVVTEAVYGDLKAFDAHCVVIARRASQEATPSEEPEPEASKQAGEEDQEGMRETEKAKAAEKLTGSGWLVVTDALQFLVEKSQLQLPGEATFADLMGFCDPCPEEEKHLRIKYTSQGRAHEVTLNNKQEEMRLPQTSHRL